MSASGRVLVIGPAELKARLESVVPPEWTVHHEPGLAGGLESVRSGGWRATLLSLDLPGVGPELVARLVGEGRCGALLLIGERVTPQLALEMTSLGAAEVLDGEADPEALGSVLARITSDARRVELPAADPGTDLVGSSPGFLEVLKTAGRVADSGATVLITGESGTGKEVVARTLHESSARRSRPFVAVNCAAIPEDLLESELFGHERGAFTGAIARKVGRFERAQGGTLFLDEIGDMSLVLQAKILRALQEREIERLGGEERIRVDVRVVAATHRDLAERMAEGSFREDLYYRLAVVRLHLPPLRERRGDIRKLALHYAARLVAEHGRAVRYIESAALERLEGHDWPGNIRELRNSVERAVLLARGEVIRPEDIELDGPRGRPSTAGEALPGYSPRLSLAEVEALHIRRVLEEVDGQLGRAAEMLGVHRNTVARKIAEYGL